VDVQLLAVLERVRRIFRAPVTITSGCRCASYNAKLGGARNSQHLYGRAADIKVEGATPAQVYRFLTESYPNRFGFGLYSGWIHTDTRSGGPARWES
jgi:uncharacterized protein YcbK (DUF882 family)